MNNQQNTPKLALKRDTYKTLKRMDREQLSEYITNIYIKGYEAGKKANTPNNLMNAIRSTLLNVADIGPTRADAIMKHLADVLGGGEQKEAPAAAQDPTHAENFLVSALYDSGEDLCKMCIHDAECNADGNFVEDQEVPREKCIEGVLKYAKTNDAPRTRIRPQEAQDDKDQEDAPATQAEPDKDLPAPPPPAIDAGQFHGAIQPEEEGQKHQIVRGKVSGTGWPIDGHTLTFEIEKDGDVYYLNDWPNESDEAVMETMHLNDPAYENWKLEDFAKLWKDGKWGLDGRRLYIGDDKVEVVQVVKEFDA